MAQLLGIHLFYFSVASRMDCLDTQRALGLGRSVQLREPFVDALRMSNGVYSLQFVCCDSILTLRITLYWWSKDQERLLCDWTLNMWPGQHFQVYCAVVTVNSQVLTVEGRQEILTLSSASGLFSSLLIICLLLEKKNIQGRSGYKVSFYLGIHINKSMF